MPVVIDTKTDKFYFIRKLDGEVPKTHVYHNKNGVWQDSILIDHFGGLFPRMAILYIRGKSIENERIPAGLKRKN